MGQQRTLRKGQDHSLGHDHFQVDVEEDHRLSLWNIPYGLLDQGHHQGRSREPSWLAPTAVVGQCLGTLLNLGILVLCLEHGKGCSYQVQRLVQRKLSWNSQIASGLEKTRCSTFSETVGAQVSKTWQSEHSSTALDCLGTAWWQEFHWNGPETVFHWNTRKLY